MQTSLQSIPDLNPSHLAETAFTAAAAIILAGILFWWAKVGEFRRQGLDLPLVFAGTALSSLTIEPVFDNILLYWYNPNAQFQVLHAYGRTIPLFVPMGYAWFFGGIAYFFRHSLTMGISAKWIWLLFLSTILIDWLAISICQWTQLSAFFGPQPFAFFGSPLWFSVCDATGAFALGASIHIMSTHYVGTSRYWLLLLPALTYGGVLGATTAPVSLALNSGWPTSVVWLAGSATIALCLVIVFAITRSLSLDGNAARS